MLDEVPHLLGAAPFLALAWLHFSGRRRRRAWWVLAGAFGVSFVADTAQDFARDHAEMHRLVSQTYPIVQGGLFAFVLAPRRLALAVVAAIAVTSWASLWWRHAEGFDLALHAVAWGSTVLLARRYLVPGALQASLVVGFSGVLAAWALYWGVAVPGVYSLEGAVAYWAMQTVRAVGIGYFCLAAWQAADRIEV